MLGDPGTGSARLVGRSRTGQVVALDSRNQEFFTPGTDTGRRVADGDYAQIVGDWDGDGRADAVTRSVGTGNVGLHRGDGTGLLGARSRLWAGWTGSNTVVATADLTGDAHQDVVTSTPAARSTSTAAPRSPTPPRPGSPAPVSSPPTGSRTPAAGTVTPTATCWSAAPRTAG